MNHGTTMTADVNCEILNKLISNKRRGLIWFNLDEWSRAYLHRSQNQEEKSRFLVSIDK